LLIILVRMMSNAEKFQVSVIALLVTVMMLDMAILKVARWPRLRSLDLGQDAANKLTSL